ncbi:MAG: hypothetical protein Q7S53_03945 [bacterium]|nr:hypothetical protein [bacterium]
MNVTGIQDLMDTTTVMHTDDGGIEAFTVVGEDPHYLDAEKGVMRAFPLVELMARIAAHIIESDPSTEAEKLLLGTIESVHFYKFISAGDKLRTTLSLSESKDIPTGIRANVTIYKYDQTEMVCEGIYTFIPC